MANDAISSSNVYITAFSNLISDTGESLIFERRVVHIVSIRVFNRVIESLVINRSGFTRFNTLCMIYLILY